MASTYTKPAAGDHGVRQVHSGKNYPASITKHSHSAQGFSLCYGHSRLPLVNVVADATWPTMFRLNWPDGTISDIANLTRCKDAAEALCERGPPERTRLRFSWKTDRSKPPVEASLVAQNGRGL